MARGGFFFLLVIKIRQRRIVTYDVRRRGNVTTCHYPRDGQLRRDGIGGRLKRDTRLRELQLAAATAHKKKKRMRREAVISSRYCSRMSVDDVCRPLRPESQARSELFSLGGGFQQRDVRQPS